MTHGSPLDQLSERELEEASFGRRFFQRRDELLPSVREILEILSRRQQFGAETASALQQVRATVDAMPEQEPTIYIRLKLSLSANYGDSSGSRTYSLAISPDCFELDLGGHEWTREAGSDAWSGPRLVVEADGRHRGHGDIEQMLREMLDAANDPDCELSFECD